MALSITNKTQFPVPPPEGARTSDAPAPPPQPPVNAAPAAPLAQPLSGAPINTSAPRLPNPTTAPANANRPSTPGLWHKILGVGMLALGAGLAGEGAAGPGPAAAAGARWMQQEQKLSQGEQALQNQRAVSQAVVAMDHARMLALRRQLSILPQNRAQEFWQSVGAPLLGNLIRSGVYQPVSGQTYSDENDAFRVAMNLNKAQSTAAYMAVHDPTDPTGSRFIVVESTNSPTNHAIQMPNPMGGPAFTIPAGTPGNAARGAMLTIGQTYAREWLGRFTATVRATNALSIAQIRATAAEVRERIKNYSSRALGESLSSLRHEEATITNTMEKINHQISAPESTLTPDARTGLLSQYRQLQDRLGQLGVEEQVEQDRLMQMTSSAPEPEVHPPLCL